MFIGLSSEHVVSETFKKYVYKIFRDLQYRNFIIMSHFSLKKRDLEIEERAKQIKERKKEKERVREQLSLFLARDTGIG